HIAVVRSPPAILWSARPHVAHGNAFGTANHQILGIPSIRKRMLECLQAVNIFHDKLLYQPLAIPAVA
ncbi:MAG: hypothetical protein ACKN94_05560, partial [Pirellulaceae bacterium]